MREKVLNIILAASAIIITVSVMFFVIMPPAIKPMPIQQLQYPINMEITTHLGNINLEESIIDKESANKAISVIHKVEFHPDSKKFLYSYRIKSNCKTNCFLIWDILDSIVKKHDINPETPYLIELLPGIEQEFTLESESSPSLYKNVAWLYVKQDEDIWKINPLETQPAPLPRN